MSKIMLNFKRYSKDWLSCLTTISILIIILILFCYFHFNENVNWDNLGSVLGAIAGLIAFIGVLFTLRQNRQQFTNSEDRAIFFELLKLFISYRDTLRVPKIEWEYDKVNYQWKITSYNELCTPEKTYEQIYRELYYCFYSEIKKSIPQNFSKEEFKKKHIPENVTQSQWHFKYKNLAIAIDNIYKEHHFSKHNGAITTIPVPQTAYDYLCLDTIKVYIERNNLKPISEAYAKAADFCFEPYKNQLGTYFRNAYYILETVSDFEFPKKYSNIFRAQLSKIELVILFFNSFSSSSNTKSRQLFLDADLFNNLELKDIRLEENKSKISRMEYVIFPSILTKETIKNNEYMSYETLKKLYDSIDNLNN
ncbi:putative phage abortive infection protein [Phocaeicola coprocola]